MTAKCFYRHNVPMEQYICQYVGKNIRLFRHRKGLNQKTLGDMAGVTAGYTASTQKGGKQPSARVIEKLAEAFEIPAARLVMNGREVSAHVTGEQRTQFWGRLEEVTVLTEYIYETLKQFQVK